MEAIKTLLRSLFSSDIKKGQVYEFKEFEKNPFKIEDKRYVTVLDYQKGYVKYDRGEAHPLRYDSMDRSSFLICYELIKD